MREIMLITAPCLTFEYNTGYNLRKIHGRTKIHCDQLLNVNPPGISSIYDNLPENINMVRQTSTIFALNDNYEGGVFNFPEQDVSFKIKKGSSRGFFNHETAATYVPTVFLYVMIDHNTIITV
jgi:hypothetical protein